MRKHCLLLVYCLFAVLNGYSSPKREMRGAWIATVANIDWPAAKVNNSTIQKQEMLLLLDSLCKCGVNTVIFQCRPTADALYKSDIEPWSEWLTGKQGTAPDDSLFDPLRFVVDEAHKRCMEVHAWINPYRVTNREDAVLAPSHLYYRKPYLFKKYGDKIFFDPGLKETEDYLISVLRDIVARYDVDALHLDDYFYPYPVGKTDFPDDETFKKNNRGFKNKADWRRDNVNRTVRRIREMLRQEKPWVQFGVSPFGVWRNKSKDARGSETKAGVTNYDHLYADVLLWAEEGWIDYLAPQLYWELGKAVADYAVLAPWWKNNTPESCRLYYGLFASGLEVNKPALWKRPNELVRQMRFNESNSRPEGVLFYSTHYFLRNPQGLLDSLKTDFFHCAAIPPLSKNAPEAFSPMNLTLSGDTLRWDSVIADGGDAISYYMVYAFPEDAVCNFDLPDNWVAKTAESFFVFDKETLLPNTHYNITVTSVNRYRSESEPFDFVSYFQPDSTFVPTIVKPEPLDEQEKAKGKKGGKRKRHRRGDLD